MATAFPEESRRDVVAVALRKQAPHSQIAKDFGISESCLHRWVRGAEIEDGEREGLTLAEEAEIRPLKKRNRFLEQENEVLRWPAIYLPRHEQEVHGKEAEVRRDRRADQSVSINQYLSTLNLFGRVQVEKRAGKLADLALCVWTVGHEPQAILVAT